jgi:amino acid transporter
MINETKQAPKFKKVLRFFDMTLFTVSAILVIDTLAPSANIGVQSISWWVITLVLFFVPYGLITAEMAAAYPQQGGVYVWVKRAFGDIWGARVTWLYWVNVALWMPSVYILFAGIFSRLFFPDMSLVWQIILGIVMSWITVGVGIITLRIGKWVPNINAFVKAVLFLVVGIAGWVAASKTGLANDFSLSNILPSWDIGLYYLPVIVYNFMGFELMSGAAEEMENPGKDIPRAILISGIFIAFFYLLGTTGMLASIPLKKMNLVQGVIDAFQAQFGTGPVAVGVVLALGIGTLYTFFANMVTWTIGANRSAAEASDEGELPAIFGRLHPRYKTPVGAFIITGIVGTAVMIIYSFFAKTSQDLFWTLFAFSSMVFLLPYLGQFPAFLKLRKMDPDLERPYRVRGGSFIGWLLVILCEIFMAQAVVFFVWVPGEPIDWSFSGPVIIGVVLTIIIGEILIRTSAAKKRRRQISSEEG